MPARHVAHALQKPFKDELERLKQEHIITPLGVDEMSEIVQQLCVSTQS